MEYKAKIANIVKNIMRLLEQNRESYWFSYFDHILKQINENEDLVKISDSILKSFQGGMGSLNDLVLHKDNVPLIDENNLLSALKDELFDVCSMIVTQVKK